jgi:hypothetical protein
LLVVKAMLAITNQRTAVSKALTETKQAVLGMYSAWRCTRRGGEDDAIVIWIELIFSSSLRFGSVKSP